MAMRRLFGSAWVVDEGAADAQRTNGVHAGSNQTHGRINQGHGQSATLSKGIGHV